MSKTKIVCTLGPASSDENSLKKMINAGMNVARINMSHSTPESALHYVEMVKKLRKELATPVAVMIDTKGPECRIGTFKNTFINLKKNQSFMLYNKNVVGDESGVSYSYKNLYKDVKVGQKILVNDGLIELKITNLVGKDIETKVVVAGKLTNRKSMFLPKTKLNIPFLTPEDKKDLEFAVQQGVEYVGASFVSSAKNVLEMRNYLDKLGGEKVRIISKIESAEGVKNLEEIISVSDGIMVARGDLGVELSIEKLPEIQKMIIEKTEKAGKLSITATEMLESMTHSIRPTRAEVSDVANAVYDRSNAVMLSAETSIGINPENVVKTMEKIARSAEQSKIALKTFNPQKLNDGSVAGGACVLAKETGAKAIVAFTFSGRSAIQISKYKPEIPTLAITTKAQTFNALALCYGIKCSIAKKIDNIDEALKIAHSKVKELDIAKKGDKIVVVLGYPLGKASASNMILIEQIK